MEVCEASISNAGLTIQRDASGKSFSAGGVCFDIECDLLYSFYGENAKQICRGTLFRSAFRQLGGSSWGCSMM